MPKHETFERRPSDPTPAQIQERAALIRKQWSKQITQRRRVWIQPVWRPPTILTMQWGLSGIDDVNDAA
jgi:hypothetical protein